MGRKKYEHQSVHYANPNQASADLTTDGTVKSPVNRESTMEELVSSFITEHGNYDRNHGPIRHLHADSHVVTVDGLVSHHLQLTLQQLSDDFPQHGVTCALQCAGNRRHTMRTRLKEVQGLDWFDGAIMNCRWEGVRLREVLLRAGVDELRARHVHFASTGQKCQQDEFYGGSIPIGKAMALDQDVLLVLKMNGKPLPARHGYPVRVIVPGYLGARSVKWLDHITVAEEESRCFYQRHDYKILPPEASDVKLAVQYWDCTPSMGDMPINACVAKPLSGSTIPRDPSGMIEVRGYAVPQGSEGPVVRVQVSGDGGVSWTDAQIDDGRLQASKWSWVLWNIRIRIDQGTGKTIFAKATDAGGNTQQAEKSTWNLRGVAYNGYEGVFDLTVV